MKCKFVIILALLIAMVSCKDDINVNLTDPEVTGKLSYKLNDDDGKGVAGVTVYLQNTELSSDSYLSVDSALTNNEGIAYFSDLPPQNYQLTTNAITVNNNHYLIKEYVQITAGIERKKITKITDFSGILNIRLLYFYDYTPVNNQGVAAYPINTVIPNSNNISDVLKQSTLKGLTDKDGYVSIKVPANTVFDFIIYHTLNGNLGWGGNRYSVEKGQKINITLYTSFR